MSILNRFLKVGLVFFIFNQVLCKYIEGEIKTHEVSDTNNFLFTE